MMLFPTKKITRQSILDDIEADRASHISFLQKFIRAKSPNPPGDTREAAQVITDYLTSHNIPFSIRSLRDDLPNIVADFPCDFSLVPRHHSQKTPSSSSPQNPRENPRDREKNSGSFNVMESGEKAVSLSLGEGERKRLVMNGHMDVFPVGDDEVWERDPWSGDVDDDGFISGRGGVDMKAGTAASVITYRYLYQLYHWQKQVHHHHHQQRQLEVESSSQLETTTTQSKRDDGLTPDSPPSSSLALTIVSDEETGGKYGSKWLLSDDERNGGSDGGSGGGGNRWKGTIMLNAEPGGLESIRFGEKGTLRLTFLIRTNSAHGAYLNLSEGAIRIATRLIASLLTIEDLPFPDNDNDENKNENENSEFKKIRKHMSKPSVQKVVDKIMGPGASSIIMKPTVNIGVIQGGTKVNVIPRECKMEVDIRIPIGMTHTTILNHIKTSILPHFPSTEMVVQEAASNPPNFCSMEHPVVEGLKRSAVFVGEGKGNGDDGNLGKEKRGGLSGFEPLEIIGVGATDCKFWRYAGVPAYTFGVSPKTQASRDERVGIEEFLDVLRTHVLTVWEFLGGGGGGGDE